ncbi:MAG: metallophosphoesterase, partial [Pseudomonadota bacterium]
ELQRITFRHVAEGSGPDVSGHYHPKARIRVRGQSISRPCFLVDHHRVILPAFGTYTGGLRADDATFDGLVGDTAIAVLTGKRSVAAPRKVIAINY